MGKKFVYFAFFILLLSIIAAYFMSVKLIRSIDNFGINTINAYVSDFCHPDLPVFDTRDFPWSKTLRDNWKLIRDEYIDYVKNHKVPYYRQLDNSGAANADLSKFPKWRALILRAWNKDSDVMKSFPVTKGLLKNTGYVLAKFSIIEPWGKLIPHIGFYKGVLRYHLTLVAPQRWRNCYLTVNGTKLYWKEGEDILFDDLFIHQVDNLTNETRVVLFLDIPRPFHNIFMDSINIFLLSIAQYNERVQRIIKSINEFAAANK